MVNDDCVVFLLLIRLYGKLGYGLVWGLPPPPPTTTTLWDPRWSVHALFICSNDMTIERSCHVFLYGCVFIYSHHAFLYSIIYTRIVLFLNTVNLLEIIVDDFTRYGEVCKLCKDSLVENDKNRFNKNRERCKCWLYHQLPHMHYVCELIIRIQ